ncbi:MAG TPA: crotonase/enoyl-CoA hydratase family protein [Aurantimonas sp.]|nr:crotonase/enoyl-CoA hydratase family protein [Aurantimonas sp.]
MSDLIQTAVQEGVLTIRMNRPDKKNAITSAMYREMADAIAGASGDDAIAAVMICGVPGAFSAGNDIKDFMAVAVSGAPPRDAYDFLIAIATSKKPLVAAVDGIAIGIGTTILMHCDLAYASPASTFRTPFLDLGVTPEAGSSLIAPRIMGDQRAFALLALGETFDAEAARQAGLVYGVSDDAETAARDAATRLAKKPPEALRIARALLRGSQEEIVQRIDLEIGHFTERLSSAEAKAAFMAFMSR